MRQRRGGSPRVGTAARMSSAAAFTAALACACPVATLPLPKPLRTARVKVTPFSLLPNRPAASAAHPGRRGRREMILSLEGHAATLTLLLFKDVTNCK